MPHLSTRIYTLLLHLYPRSFRAQFGQSMLADFTQLIADHPGSPLSKSIAAWARILPELLPTALHQHLQANTLSHLLRPLLASLAPIAAYLFFLERMPNLESTLALSLWFAATAAGIFLARGQGLAAMRNALLASSLATLLIFSFSPPPVGPGAWLILPLLLLTSATASLILSFCVRLIIEGINLPRCLQFA